MYLRISRLIGANEYNSLTMKGFFLFIIGLTLSSIAFAQTQEQKVIEYEMQRQASDSRMLSNQLDSAVVYADEGNYIEADTRFKLLLKAYKSIPSDLVFYFGKNSYHLGNFSQSVDWLTKYIQLKGTTGQFSEEAVKWKKLAEEEIVKEKKKQSLQAAQVLSRDYDIDCGPTGKITCPVCKGSTVIIKKGYIGETYKTCPYCGKHGFLECEDYNRLLRGELQPNNAND